MAQYKAFCQNPDCEIEYLASRKDTKYCCKNCRNANYRIRQREAKEIESKQREWAERLQTELARLQAENERQQMILSEHAKIKLEGLPVLKSIREEREHLRLQIIVWERVLSLSVLETYNKYFNERVREAIRYWKGSPEERNALIQYFKGAPFDQILELQKETHLYPGERRYNMVEMFREAKQRELEEFTSLILELDMEKQKRSRVLLNSPKIVEAAKSAINSNNEKIGQLKSKLANPPEIQKPTLKPQKAKPLLRFDQKKKKGGKVNVRDLRGMEFNTFTLDGELGRFLGNIERNMMAVALTGNPGAGKSQFTFFMARVLLDAGLSVMYFSLEEGIGQTTIEKLDRAMIEEGGAMDFEAQGKLHDVRNAAGTYDAVMIDSWQKLGVKSEEFDRLRQDFPTTIFIFIFQKTQGGKTRGGSMIDFDCSAAIDVKLEGGSRIADMIKSRYGTQGWKYNIDCHHTMAT